MKAAGPMREERGFTLVELMLSVLLLSILFLAVWGLFGQGFILWKQGESKIDMHESLRVSLDRMTRELRYAQGITASSDSGNLYFVNAEGTTVRYYCSSYALYRQEQGAVAQPVASDIQSVGFVYLNSSGAEVTDLLTEAASVTQVKITITAKKQGSRVDPIVLTQKVSLRSLS